MVPHPAVSSGVPIRGLTHKVTAQETESPLRKMKSGKTTGYGWWSSSALLSSWPSFSTKRRRLRAGKKVEKCDDSDFEDEEQFWRLLNLPPCSLVFAQHEVLGANSTDELVRSSSFPTASAAL